jgi:hypothetical protein
MTAGFRSPGRWFVALALACAVALSWLGPLETAANAQVDAGLKRALLSFASARALNAVISLAQGTELAFQPLGMGVTVSAGQVLDPVNDLVEQFANLMLAASVAFGVQKVLLAIGAHWLVSLLFAGVALAWATFLLRRRRSPPWLTRFLVVLVSRWEVTLYSSNSLRAITWRANRRSRSPPRNWNRCVRPSSLHRRTAACWNVSRTGWTPRTPP